jgi:hypothetical protein
MLTAFNAPLEEDEAECCLNLSCSIYGVGSERCGEGSKSTIAIK